MSFWSADELAALDYVVIRTKQGTTDIEVRSPGVCKLTGDGIPVDWDVRSGFGLAGKTQVFMGLGLAEFQLALRMWTTEQRSEFEFYDSMIEPSPPGSPQKVYTINNPILALRGITQCIFLNAPFVADQGDDSVIATYKCRQWRKPLPTLASPTSPAASTPEGAAQSQYQQMVGERLTQIQQLNGGG